MALHGPVSNSGNKITFQGSMIDILSQKVSARVHPVMAEVISYRHWKMMETDLAFFFSFKILLAPYFHLYHCFFDYGCPLIDNIK